MDNSSFVRIRRAQALDQTSIRALICKARINPLGLHWRRFKVAVDQGGNVIGCGQIKKHRDGSRELASIAVARSWRNKGIASSLIHRLLSTEMNPVWLMCRSELMPFYEKFNFRVVLKIEDMPPYFQRVMKFWEVLGTLRGERYIGKVMVWSREEGTG
jgi:N-acetylglutamate synthase-like GNAT family acetyltransferase